MTVATSPRNLFLKKGRAERGGEHFVSVRVPDDLMQRLARWGNDSGYTLSESVRAALELGLDAAK